MGPARLAPFLLLALLGALLVTALGAWADPADVTSPPTEDWVFDEGRTTTISSTGWTVGYNITVTAGSTLNIDTSTWSMESASGAAPVWIVVDAGSTLSVDSSRLASPGGSKGFYIQVVGSIALTDCALDGMVANPSNHGALSAYGGDVYMHTVNMTRCIDSHALYAHNSNVTILWTLFADIGKCAIRFHMDGLPAGDNRTLSVFDITVTRTGSSGIRMSTHACLGAGELYLLRANMDNVTSSGVWVEQGDGTTADHGQGDLNITLEGLVCRDVGEHGVHTTSYYQETGPAGMGRFDVTLIDCLLERCDGAGVYALVYESDVEYELAVEGAVVSDIGLDVAEDGLPGMVLEHTNTGSSGSVNASIDASLVQGCAWGGFLDKGNCDMVSFTNTTFRENAVYGVYSNIPRNGEQTPVSLTSCSFIGNDGYGMVIVNEIQPSGGGAIVDVVDSVFTYNAGPALGLDNSLTINQNKPIFTGYNVTGCTIEGNPGSPAIWYYLYRFVGDVFLYLRDSHINDTGGVQVIGGIGLNVDSRVLVEDTEISNTAGKSIDVTAQANTQTLLNVTLDGLTAHSLTGDAVSISNNMAREQTTTVTSLVYVWDCDIVSDKGTALWVSTNGKHQSGDTRIDMMNTTLDGMNRGLVLRGHDGLVSGCGFHGRLLEDILVIDSFISLRHVDLSGPLEDTVVVLTRGEVKLFSTLQVYVTWGSGLPAVGATVMVRDNSLTTLAIRSAQAPDGRIPLLTINTYIVQASGIITRNPYTINASFSGVSSEVGVVLEEDSEVTVVMYDNVPPAVHILYPESGSVQQSSQIRLVGAAWDYQSELAYVRYSLDGENWTTLEAVASWNVRVNVTNETIQRFDGRMVLQVVAMDNAGNEAMDVITVRIIQQPPGVTVYFPPDGYVTNVATLKVSGVTDMGATVRVNGLPVDLVVTLFETTVNLVEGRNTISVMSTDVLGNTAVERVEVTLDTRPPYLVLRNPGENMVTNLNTLTVVAVLENDLSVKVNGEEVGYGSDWYPLDSGRLEYPVTLVEHENNIVVEAVDPAGNAVRISRQVLFDSTPPWIEVTRPLQDALVNSHYLEVVGTVDPTAVLRLDGEVVTTSNGIFMVSISVAEGDNTIVLWAVDGAGNEHTLELGFSVDTEAPHLAVTAPGADPEMVTASRYTIRGSVMEGDTVTATTLLLDGHPYTLIDDGGGSQTRVDLAIGQDGTFEIPVDLADGMNELTVTVLDGADNAASMTVRVVLDTQAPLLTVVVDPSRTTEEGALETWDRNLHLSGSTDPGAVLTLNGVPIVVGDDGTYDAYLRLPAKGTTTLTLTSVDPTGNVREVEVEMSYQASEEEADDGTSWALIGGIVVFVVLVLLAVMYVLSSTRGDQMTRPESAPKVEANEADQWEEDVADQWEEEETDELEELIEDLEKEQGGER